MLLNHYCIRHISHTMARMFTLTAPCSIQILLSNICFQGNHRHFRLYTFNEKNYIEQTYSETTIDQGFSSLKLLGGKFVLKLVDVSLKFRSSFFQYKVYQFGIKFPPGSFSEIVLRSMVVSEYVLFHIILCSNVYRDCCCPENLYRTIMFIYCQGFVRVNIVVILRLIPLIHYVVRAGYI